MSSVDDRIVELAEKYRPLAAKILAEVIRIPSDYVDRPENDGGDPFCGLTNHEGPRPQYPCHTIVAIGAPRHPDDVGLYDFGHLTCSLDHPADGILREHKQVNHTPAHHATV